MDDVGSYFLGGAVCIAVGVVLGAIIVGFCWSTYCGLVESPAERETRLKTEAERLLINEAVSMVRKNHGETLSQ